MFMHRKTSRYDPLWHGVPPILLPPTTPPLICIQFHEMYLPLIVGALRGLLHEGVWNSEDESERETSLSNVGHLLELFATSACPPENTFMCFVGQIIPYFGTTEPSGCLPLNGNDYAISDYPDLAAVLEGWDIGTDQIMNTPTAGRFRLPNFAGRSLVGIGTRGLDPYDDYDGEVYEQKGFGGEARHTLSTSEIPSHTHPLPSGILRRISDTSPSTALPTAGTLVGYNQALASSASGGGSSHNNMPPYMVVSFAVVAVCEVNSMSFRIRQNTLNPCLMEQSLDNGSSWIAAFDYSLCEPPASSITKQIYIQLITNVYNDIVNNYDGTAGSIDPILEYGDEHDGLRDDLLCTALFMYFNAAGIMAAEAKQADLEGRAQTWDEISDFASNMGEALGGGIIATILTGTAFAAISPLLPALAVTFIGASLFADFVSVWSASEAAGVVWDDEDLAWQAACCVKESLMGATITEAGFRFAISDCFAVATGDYYYFAQMLNMFNTDTAPYLVFLQMMADLMPLAMDGIELPCNCVETICESWDFTDATVPAGITLGAGTSHTVNVGLTNASGNCSVTWDSPVGIVNIISINLYCELEGAAVPSQSVIFNAYIDTTVTALKNQENNPSTAQNVIWLGAQSADSVQVIAEGSGGNDNWIYSLEICYEV